MFKLLLRKLIQGLMLVLIVSAVTFALLSAAGGDSFTSLRDNSQVSSETIENLRRIYGLDRPLAVRYASWLGDAVRGHLGESYYFRTSVTGLVVDRFAYTLTLSLVALAVSLTIAVGLSVLSVRFRRRWLTRVIEAIVLLTSSTPRLVLALFGLALMVRFNALSAFWMAVTVLAVPLISVLLAQFHDGLDSVMAEEFIKLARAKGLSEGVVIIRHAIRAALNPVLTAAGLSLGGLLSGSVIVEMVIGRPGLGSVMVIAVRNRDIPLIMGSVLIASAAVWFGNALAELLQMINDKRMRSMETD